MSSHTAASPPRISPSGDVCTLSIPKIQLMSFVADAITSVGLSISDSVFRVELFLPLLQMLYYSIVLEMIVLSVS